MNPAKTAALHVLLFVLLAPWPGTARAQGAVKPPVLDDPVAQ